MHRITPVIYNGSPQSRWQNHVLVAEQSKDGGFPTSFAQHTRKKFYYKPILPMNSEPSKDVPFGVSDYQIIIIIIIEFL